jgi:excisionase family DNA binding protein
MDTFHNISTTAKRIAAHPETVRRMIRRGDLPATKIGKQWRVSERAMQKYLDQRATLPQGADE